ncbi:hypothetical protein G6R29_01940 [Fructobacillus sp. M2-14]|uniref:Uncharacterized protein n=1 Tax=Fructobacillus broussonetiae TaxID=2713173 RepID=A0ABS5R2L6_9LACO|nr:hypothetical protein [Fructobacillus broussonetiae]MBS9338397.1 hypothetical protein [Fructobacillus broussonetiae]
MGRRQLKRAIIPNQSINQNKGPTVPQANIKKPHFVFKSQYNWLGSVKYKGFTNYYKDSKEFSKIVVDAVHELIPTIYECADQLFKGTPQKTVLNHSHKIDDKTIGLVKKIAQKNFISSEKIEDDMVWWQLGGRGSVRIIGVYVASDNAFYPLFIDPHHLIYPSKDHNQKDYLKLRYGF